MDVSSISGLPPTSIATTAPSTANAAASTAQAAATASAGAVYYSSPIFTVDTLTGALVQVWRDSKTGETLSQSPSRTALLYDKTQGYGAASSRDSRTGGLSIQA